MSRLHRLSGFLTLCLLVGCAAGLRPVQARVDRPAPERPTFGTLRGQVDRRSAPSAARLQFLVDGVPQRALVSGIGFTLRRVLSGDHVLTVLNEATGAGRHIPFVLRPNGSLFLGVITLVPGGEVAGTVRRVLDPDTGAAEPLAGVEVALEPESGILERLRHGVPPGGTKPLTTRTGPDGSYRFPDLPTGAYRLSVVVPGLEAGVSFVFVGFGDQIVQDFFLREAIEEGVATLRGVVRNAEGEPLEGALVIVFPQEVYVPPVVAESSRQQARRLGKIALTAPDTLPRREFSTLTNRNGEYSLNVNSGYLVQLFLSDGLREQVRNLTLRPREVRNVDATLEPIPPPAVGAVQGVVRIKSSGKPLKGVLVTALVFVIQEGEPGARIFPPPPPIQAVTDANGQYRLEGLPVGLVEIQTELRGYQTTVQSVEIRKGETVTLDFGLSRTRRVR